jgi:LmbE family N-acetylglucosaminyl deacetylase
MPAPAHAPRRTRSLAAVFAHPDDETFAIAGTLAGLRAEGVRTTLFCATDGDAGRSSGVAVEGPAALGALRRRELEAACARLGVARIVSAGFPDGKLGVTDPDGLVGRIVAFLREERPDVVVTFGPEGGPNLHTDHRAIFRATVAAVMLADVPTAFPELGLAPHRPARLWCVAWDPRPAGSTPPALGQPVTARVVLAPASLAAKRDAFELHATQHQHRATFETLALVPHECYHLVLGVPQPAAVVDDLFAGL